MTHRADNEGGSKDDSARMAGGQSSSSLWMLIASYFRDWIELRIRELRETRDNYSRATGDICHSVEWGHSDEIFGITVWKRSCHERVTGKKTPLSNDLLEEPLRATGCAKSYESPTARHDHRANRPRRVFISYARSDHKHRDNLVRHLSALRASSVVELWHDRMILPGDNFAEVIDARIRDAELVLLLVTSDFISSEYCYGIEFKAAQASGCIIIPIYVRECDHAGLPFADLGWLPDDSRFRAITPVTSPRWRGHDNAWANVVTGIRKRLEDSGDT